MTYSVGLRKRVVDFVGGGGSKEAAARQFHVSPIGWSNVNIYGEYR